MRVNTGSGRLLLTVVLAAAMGIACDDDGTPTADKGVTPPDGGAADKGPTPDGAQPTACELDKAAPATKVGGIFTLTQGGSASTQAANKDQLDLIVHEVNNGCGALGDATKGTPIEAVSRDGQDDANLTPALTDELITKDGVVLMVGAGGSAPTTPSARDAVKKGIPYGVYFATGDSLTGCTAEQLADSVVEKTADPVFEAGKCWDHKGLVVRTATLSTIWGKTAAKFVKETWPDAKKAAVIYRDDSFGKPIKDTFKEAFTAGGGGVPGEMVPYAQGTAKDDFKPLVKTLVQDDPDVVIGVWRIGELKAFLEAYVELGEDPAWTEKPANYDAIKFVNAGSVRTDYKDLSTKAIAVLAERSMGLEPYWDPESEGFKRWLAAYQDYDPEGKATVHTQMRTYDALMVLVLAMVKAKSADGAQIAKQLAAVANPPGDKVYPGEFAKARALLMEGKEINYEGASGSVDLADTGDIRTTPYQVWATNPDGTAKLVKAYASAE